MRGLPQDIGALSEETTVPNLVELKPQLIAVAFDLAPYFTVGILDQPGESQPGPYD